MATQVNSMDDSDRISSLPDPIISHILSFLPTKEAIRTSVLAPRWRYLFASMSTFDFGRDCLRTLTSRNGNNFKNFVDRLLHFPNPVSLECFRLSGFSWVDDESHLIGWIPALLSRGVKELVLCLQDSHMLPAHLFASHSLVTLKLYTYGEIKVPSDACLPNLKTLHLQEFTLLDDSIFRLISSCPVLEELDLMPEQMYVSEVIIRSPSLKRLFLYLAVRGGRESNRLVEINAPNLVQFDYGDDSAESYSISHMESLKKAHITIYDDDERDPANLVQAVCNVRSLYMKVPCLRVQLFQVGREPVAFNNLVELHLDCALGDWLVEFLHLVPNLKILILTQTFADEFRHGRVAPPCLSFHLKEITFSGFIGDDKEVFKIYSYFLNHALVLEKLRITINKQYPKEEYSDLKKILRSLKISIHKLYLKDVPSIIKKVLRLPGGRDVEVSVELKEDKM